MRLRDVLEPAIGYAINGFPLVFRAAASIPAIADYFTANGRSSAEVWLQRAARRRVPNQIIATPSIGRT